MKNWLTAALIFPASSVARGANGARAPPPIGLNSMQNSMLLAVLRLVFALKREIAPPQTKIFPPKIVKWEVKVGVSWQKNALKFGKDFFLEITRFWQKNALNLLQSNWNQMKIRVKFVYSWIKLQKKPPPPFAKSWLRDYFQPLKKL